MKKSLISILLLLCIVLAGCGGYVSNIPEPSKKPNTETTGIPTTEEIPEITETPTEGTTQSTTQETTEVVSQPVQVDYMVAFNFVKQCEDNIIKNNQYDFNKYNESAAEKIIYSDEYATLYCSYWNALEIIDNGNDSRFGKSKMRWQIDYSSEEWTNLLIDALKSGGLSSFQNEYARLYTEEVFPKVEYRWENGVD